MGWRGHESGVAERQLPGMRRHAAAVAMLLAGLLLGWTPGAATGAEQTPGSVRILAVVDASVPLTVDYRTAGNLIRQLVMMGSLLDYAIQSSRDSGYSERLRKAVGGLDRSAIVSAAVKAAFETTPYFRVDVARDARPDQVDFARARRDGYPYVLVVREELAGFISAWEMSTLSAFSQLAFELFAADGGRSMAKGSIVGYATVKHAGEEAADDRAKFIADYPSALGAALGRIHGDLSKDGKLHEMAAAVGLGDRVPNLGQLLARYADRFETRVSLPQGWEQVDLGSKYSTVMQPASDDKQKFGVRLDVDLLIREFAQDVDTAEAYAAIFLAKAARQGLTVRAEQPASPFRLRDAHVVVWADRPARQGSTIILFRKISPTFVAIYQVVLLAEPAPLLERYRAEVESLIDGTEIVARAER